MDLAVHHINPGGWDLGMEEDLAVEEDTEAVDLVVMVEDLEEEVALGEEVVLAEEVVDLEVVVVVVDLEVEEEDSEVVEVDFKKNSGLCDNSLRGKFASDILGTIHLTDRSLCLQMGCIKQKKCLQACAKCADSHLPAHAQSHLGICSALKYSIVSYDSVCGQQRPNQTAHPCSLVRAFAVRICLKTHFCMARPK